MIHEILNSSKRMYVQCPDQTMEGALEYGFSYVETQDNMVRYIVVGPVMAKRIFSEIKDSIVELGHEKVGRVWTADILISKKLKDNRLVFSNEPVDTVLVLDINNITAEVNDGPL